VSRADGRQLQRLVLAFTRHGITERADRLRLCSQHAGRRLSSSSQLTSQEATGLEHRLNGLPVNGALTAWVAHLVQEEEREARERASRPRPSPAVIVCRTGGGGPPTAEDLAAVQEFAEQLQVLADAGLIPTTEETP